MNNNDKVQSIKKKTKTTEIEAFIPNMSRNSASKSDSKKLKTFFQSKRQMFLFCFLL